MFDDCLQRLSVTGTIGERIFGFEAHGRDRVPDLVRQRRRKTPNGGKAFRGRDLFVEPVRLPPRIGKALPGLIERRNQSGRNSLAKAQLALASGHDRQFEFNAV